MDEDSKRQRKMEDSGGELLPAVEGHSREIIEYNTISSQRRELSPARTLGGKGACRYANHMHRIERSRATCTPRGTKAQLSSPVLQS